MDGTGGQDEKTRTGRHLRSGARGRGGECSGSIRSLRSPSAAPKRNRRRTTRARDISGFPAITAGRTAITDGSAAIGRSRRGIAPFGFPATGRRVGAAMSGSPGSGGNEALPNKKARPGAISIPSGLFNERTRTGRAAFPEWASRLLLPRRRHQRPPAAPASPSRACSRCRRRRDRPPTRPVAAAIPGSALPTADLRCTSAAPAAAGARRNCGPSASSPECTSRASSAHADLDLLRRQILVDLLHQQVHDLEQVLIGRAT